MIALSFMAATSRSCVAIVLAWMIGLGGANALADDHADIPGRATPLAPGAFLNGEIFPARDRDWFSLRATSGAEYRLETRVAAGTDTVLTLVDSDGATTLAVAATPVSFSPGSGRLSASLESPSLYDPKLGDGAGHAALPVRIGIAPAGVASRVDLEVRESAGALVRRLLQDRAVTGGATLSLNWDGRDATSGKIVDPGEYSLRLEARSTASASPAVIERALQVVRLGAVALSIRPVPGAGEEHDCIFHNSGGLAYNDHLVPAGAAEWTIGPEDPSDAGDLDRRDGNPRPGPTPWARLDRPPSSPRNASLPAVLSAGTFVRIEAALGERAVSQATGRVCSAGYPVAGLPVRLLVNGVAAFPENAVPGGLVSADLTHPVSPAVDREDLELRLRFEAIALAALAGEVSGEVAAWTFRAERGSVEVEKGTLVYRPVEAGRSRVEVFLVSPRGFLASARAEAGAE